MKSIRLIQVSAAILMTAAISTSALATNNSDHAKNQEHKVGICHATGSKTNPYVYIVVDKHAAEAHKKHQNGRDVIGVSSADKCPKPGSVLATTAPTPAATAEQPTVLPHTGAGLISLLAASAAALGSGIYYRRRQA